MKDATDVLRIVGIILLGIFVFAVGIPLVLTAAGITLGIIKILFGIAVLVDATIVRALLVPSLMRLLGDWNWWAARCRSIHWPSCWRLRI